MATLRAFRALRFTQQAGKSEQLTCPPYDIISEQQRLAYLQRNPNNIIRLELPRDGENPYLQAGSVLRGWLQDGTLKQDEKDLTMQRQKGFQLLSWNLFEAESL